jgi:spermidine synthase
MSDGAFEDPRVEVIYKDGRQFLVETEEQFDVAILDLPEPLPGSPPCRLFTKEFYALLCSRLSRHGLVTLQAGPANPFYLTMSTAVMHTLRTAFAKVQPYTLLSPFFATEWSFALCTVDAAIQLPLDPHLVEQRLQERVRGELRFYDSVTHQHIFSLPKHLRIALEQGRHPITDDSLLYRFEKDLEAALT